ncbi:phosphatase PAP2 family protein [Flavobacterium silvaticum]|uniref:Phosphatase PAP2 family protein n=1 Tax=Flavobacterium silvaticum TaxID=1852020 RepID=A0A972FM07_9FLAO|nr:phosphatase PAP2 family protein [Flavobacterium silvaticum]NMH28471.1 phosphatase PAP2 family protein [Flavobacterium silvaticum]
MNRLSSLLFLVLIPFLSFGQDTIPAPVQKANTSIWQDLGYDSMSMLQGAGHAFVAPGYWDKNDFITAGGLVVGTSILWISDEPINDYFTNQSAGVPQGIKDGGYYFGKPLYNYALTGGIYCFGLFTRNEKIRKTGVLIVSSASAAAVVQTVLKNAVGRARPYTGHGPATFHPFSKEEGFHSFPSGHAILSFTTAYAISKQFKSPWVKGGLWALGLVTPVSRMWAGAHWASDVGVGIMLSVITVESVNKFLNANRYQDPVVSKKKISWNINFTKQTIGLTGTF